MITLSPSNPAVDIIGCSSCEKHEAVFQVTVQTGCLITRIKLCKLCRKILIQKLKEVSDDHHCNEEILQKTIVLLKKRLMESEIYLFKLYVHTKNTRELDKKGFKQPSNLEKEVYKYLKLRKVM